MTRHKHRHGIKWRSLYEWHRIFGLTAAVFVLLLALSGILLNHTDDMNLAKRKVQAGWLLDWYGIEGPGDISTYGVDKEWVSEINGHVYLNARPLGEISGPVIGAIGMRQWIAIAYRDGVWLISHKGEVIEKVGTQQGVTALGINPEGALVIKTGEGNYKADEAVISWKQATGDPVEWSERGELPPVLRERLSEAYRGQGLSMERILLDIHSGRIFGRGGVWLMDAMAGLMLLLALTGFWLWAKRKR